MKTMEPRQPRPLLVRAAGVLLINILVLLVLLIPIELIFGNWIRPIGLTDLKRFSIPVDVSFDFDVSNLYTGSPRNPIKSSRDQWGLRGDYGTLADVNILTIGGSTTDQRYLDDQATWQAAAERELERLGRPLKIANAGVDGQSSVGHLFDFQYWFPLLTDLRPQVMLYYTGANDVLRHATRDRYDARVDASTWRFKSATFQLYRTFRDNMRARDVRVWHGRMHPTTEDDFTDKGMLTDDERRDIASQMTSIFLTNIEQLTRHTLEAGAVPIYVTQTAFAWNADQEPPRGLKETVHIYGTEMNYADVAFLHQSANRGLMDYCARERLTCLDLASDVRFGVEDYYDYLHNTPAGAEKIGRYLATRIAALDPGIFGRGY